MHIENIESTSATLQTLNYLPTLNLQTTIQGQIESVNTYVEPVKVSNEGYLNCQLMGVNASSFGDQRFVTPTPICQFSFTYGLNSNYVVSGATNAGSVAVADRMAVVTSGTLAADVAYVRSRRFSDYRSGEGNMTRLTAKFSAGMTSNVKLAGIANAVYPSGDGFFFGYNGTAFGIMYLRAGVVEWVAQADWNGDTMLGTGGASNKSGLTLDPQSGNIYQITTAYLGFGNICFYVFAFSSFILVHTLRFANVSAQTNMGNPSMYVVWQSYNTGATAAPNVVYGASAAMFTDGAIASTGAKYSRSAATTALTTSPKNIITLRNNAAVNGVANRSTITIDEINFYAIDNSVSTNNNAVILYAIYNPTITGGTYVDIDSTNSIASYNTTNTYSGGTTLLTYTSCFTSSFSVDLSRANLHLNVGDVLVLALASQTAAASCTAGVSVSWSENT